MLPSKAANPPRITAKISTIASNVSSICTIMARIQPQWGVALGGGIALRHHDGLPHGEQAQAEHLQRHLRQNLQRVPDRSAARRQNLASSGLPNRQCAHCFILSPRYRWSVESIRLLARATEASALHAAPVVQPETTSPCLTPTPCPVTHRYAATMPRGARPITTRQSTVVPIPLFSGKTQNTQPTARFDDFYAYESCRESEQPALSAYNR